MYEISLYTEFYKANFIIIVLGTHYVYAPRYNVIKCFHHDYHNDVKQRGELKYV